MFDKLLVSTARRRSRRTAKFFVCTSTIYLSAVAFAFALSVLLPEPKLADSSSWREVLVAPSPPPGLRPTGVVEKHRDPESAPRQDLNNVMTYDTIVGQRQSNPIASPSPHTIGDVGQDQGVPAGDPNGVPGAPIAGVIRGDVKVSDAPPRPPDQPKPEPRSATNGKPLPVSSIVLQGKVIERRVPIYPELPRRIRLQGEVAVEVIISPEGRVESVRTVSGHPMFTQSALDAARAWRFSPTLLNGVPVRVTGVITFVFKLSE